LIPGKFSVTNCYGNQLVSGPKVKQFPWKPLLYTQVSIATTTVP